MNETHLRLLRVIEANPQATQRELAEALGVSLGKAHYCLRALVDKGWVKVRNFRASPNKLGYVHVLTRRGIEAKAQLTMGFLRRKVDAGTGQPLLEDAGSFTFSIGPPFPVVAVAVGSLLGKGEIHAISVHAPNAALAALR